MSSSDSGSNKVSPAPTTANTSTQQYSSFAGYGNNSSSQTAAEAPSLCAAILEDHAFIKEDLPKAAILTLTGQFVTVVIMRTPYSRVQLRVQYLEKYPFEAPLVELSSPSLPTPLLRNKEKECVEKAKEHLGEPQVKHIYEIVYSFIQSNMFIPCWREMKQVASLCEGKGTMTVNEGQGVLQLRLKVSNYHQGIRLKVPPLYPEEGVAIEFLSSNFPKEMQYMFRCQAEEIVRRCMAGFKADDALAGSNPIELPATGKASKGPAVRLTAGNLKDLKHDLNVLKQISDLRVATVTKDKKYQYALHGNAERRDARKELRKLAKAELNHDETIEKKVREEEQAEMKELMKLKISDTAQPSLLVAARFLLDNYVNKLPVEKCQNCQKTVLPEIPDDDVTEKAQGSSGKEHSLKPMRTYCGHWLHFKCLNDWLTSPPFIRQCPVCDRRIWHPDWPADHKMLEKAYMMAEERRREVADCSDFLSLGPEFTVKTG